MPTCSTGNKHQPTIDNVFGKEWCMNLWRHEASHVGQKDDTHLDSSVNTEEVGLTYILLLKKYNAECSLLTPVFFIILANKFAG